jgi:hypothetical protein
MRMLHIPSFSGSRACVRPPLVLDAMPCGDSAASPAARRPCQGNPICGGGRGVDARASLAVSWTRSTPREGLICLADPRRRGKLGGVAI